MALALLSGTLMRSIGQDVRYAMRLALRRPALTTITILTLAIGVWGYPNAIDFGSWRLEVDGFHTLQAEDPDERQPY